MVIILIINTLIVIIMFAPAGAVARTPGVKAEKASRPTAARGSAETVPCLVASVVVVVVVVVVVGFFVVVVVVEVVVVVVVYMHGAAPKLCPALAPTVFMLFVASFGAKSNHSTSVTTIRWIGAHYAFVCKDIMLHL